MKQPLLSERLATVSLRVREQYDHCIGFPIARDVDYREVYPFFDMHINNVGDPYVMSLVGFHTKDLEQEVLAFFADLWHAPAGSRWGYTTSGSTEGNMYGLFAGREVLPGAMLYHSAASHYSIPKSGHILGLPSTVIPTQPKGEIDYDALGSALHRHRDRPAIVVANIGTTMTEAVDDVARIKQMLQDTLPGKHYIHVDAALVGGYAPFMASQPRFDFAQGADCIVVSGHKFFGTPVPCGLVLARRSREDETDSTIPYIATLDTTIAGSRSGHASLLLWYMVQKYGLDGLRARYVAAEELAATTIKKLKAIGWEAWRNVDGLTVVLRDPGAEVRVKWQLATADGWSHIICMPGVTAESIDACIADIAATRKR
jgi:histidine decarboxylase